MDITKYFTENNLVPLILDHFLDIITHSDNEALHEVMNDDSNQYRNFIIDYIAENFLPEEEHDEDFPEKILDHLAILLEQRIDERVFLYGNEAE
jgi:hypothetical protein